LDDGTAVVLKRSADETADDLKGDGAAYRKLMGPLLRHWEVLADEFLQPMLHFSRHPFVLAQFARRGLRSACAVARSWFTHEPAKALFGGLAAHSFLPLDQLPSSAFALVLGLAGHAVGWPMPRGGTQMLTQALAGYFRSLGGEIRTNTRVRDLADCALAPIRVLDVTPRQFVQIAEAQMPNRYRARLNRYRYGPGVFKVDYALDRPIPWRSDECRRAGTVHLGGTFAEVAKAEALVAEGSHPERPFVLLAQPTLFDPSRAPESKHIAWAYTHVPNGSNNDMAPAI
jgi:phytoene dehydrogenase-like protein